MNIYKVNSHVYAWLETDLENSYKPSNSQFSKDINRMNKIYAWT